MNAIIRLTDAKEALVRAAEKLIAERGLDAVSDREIARAAGQKNNSAVQYHFGDRAGLINAILDFRMIPLNQKRHEMLDELLNRKEPPTTRDLVKVLLLPYMENLKTSREDSSYTSLVSQLFQRGNQQILAMDPPRSSSLVRMTEAFATTLPHLSVKERHARLTFMGSMVVHTVARWDQQCRLDPETWTPEHIVQQTRFLIEFLAGGMDQDALQREPESRS
ncbi:TetR/AcrR family transcriptional regulator [Endozoicomonas sp. 8E]|uniref:TetR/AcrR family transcriptional regulator n=1 Tax=Endozoicomonas sp. 8E TaxID=3035692 RepID=UPI002938E325|nr:TetR/AcrR family transcriptional regulator [Endozoicomonas sp. 8E]WOG26521.1 TetR/AcrR family transcriptional regulator [Endozoicomonas sp. 8E]